jgi:5'-nucleotidase
MDKPLILVSNDDGYDAPGCVALAAALAEFADVVVVAPEREQSAKSHAITLSSPLRHRVVAENVHAIGGTPVDCVYVALFHGGLLPRRPDLVASGINHGPNLGMDIHYSGTVAAAREGAMRGVPAIAFSSLARDVVPAAPIAAELCRRMLAAVMPEGQPALLNVNFPKGDLAGVRATRLGHRHYAEGVDVRTDPRGREYFWIGGPGGVEHGGVEGSDTQAVDAGYASVTPLSIESTLTAHLGLAAYVAGDGTADESPGDP